MKRQILLLLTAVLLFCGTTFSQPVQKLTPEIKKWLNAYYDAQETSDAAKGIAALTELIAADPHYAPYYSARASIRIYQKDTSIQRIIDDLSAAIENDSNNIEYYKNRANYYFSLAGETFAMAGARDCNKILSLDSTYFTAYQQLHTFYISRDAKAASAVRWQSQTEMQKLVEKDSMQAENWFHLAQAYSLQEDAYESKANKDRALNYYSRAIELDSTQYKYYWERAMKYYWYKKDYASCLKDIQRILQLNSVYIYYEYESLCYEKLGKKSLALEAVNTGLNIYPGQPNLLEQKSHLEKKRKTSKRHHD